MIGRSMLVGRWVVPSAVWCSGVSRWLRVVRENVRRATVVQITRRYGAKMNVTGADTRAPKFRKRCRSAMGWPCMRTKGET